MIMKQLMYVLLAFCSITAMAQDYHYWSDQYGVRASLLGAAATAGLGDNGTVFYNPSSMAFVENPNLSASINAYGLRKVKIYNALGTGLNLDQTQFSTTPNLIADVVTFAKKPKWRVGYAVITKQAFTSHFDYLHQASYEILKNTAGFERFVASYNYHHSINEYWAGFGVSWNFKPSWSLGFSHFGIYRDVKYSNHISMNALPEDYTTGDVSIVTSKIDFNYWTLKGVLKPSISLNVENFKFGMTYTTPSLNILGKADVFREFSLVNMDEVVGTDVSFIDRRTGVKANHKHFGSLAFGTSYRLGRKSWLHFSNEYFFNNNYYTIFNPDNDINKYPAEFINDSLTLAFFGEQNFLAYGDTVRPLMNFGLGFETKIGKRMELMLGVRTDFNYNAQPYFIFQRIVVEASKWHLFHFSIGGSYTTKKEKKYTLGFEYGMTPDKKFYQFSDFTKPTTQTNLVGQRNQNAYARQASFKVVLGIELEGKKKDEEPTED